MTTFLETMLFQTLKKKDFVKVLSVWKNFSKYGLDAVPDFDSKQETELEPKLSKKSEPEP
jgi:hypothetical protein